MSPKDPKPQVWLQQLDQQTDRHCLKLIAEELMKAHITFSEKSNEENEYGILLADEFLLEPSSTKLLCEYLDQCENLILVYTGEKPLPFFKIWELLKTGIEEVLSLQDSSTLSHTLKTKLQRWSVIKRIMQSETITNYLIGSSKTWIKTLRQIVEIACFSSVPVLIQGESGTGKELVARLIHELDKRSDKQDLVLLDCTTIVPELSGSEFFGHEKGAFTNAVASRDGAFALADRGTLFLDEIGELPMRLQAELLRVSQEGLYKKVGSNHWRKTKFRLVSATHRDLQGEVEAGRFRQDLYYRIRTCAIRLPSLKERKFDILELASHFLKQCLNKNDVPAFSPMMVRYLLSQDFPGNVRELKQLIARIAYRYYGSGVITLGHLPMADREQYDCHEEEWKENGFHEAITQAISDGIGLKEIKKSVGEIAIDLAIKESDGNLQQAARKLQVSDRMIQAYWSEKNKRSG